jgi:aminopeptidase N
LADQILLIDALNPQIAARLLSPLTRWRKYNAVRQSFMKAALTRILQTEAISKDVYEIASKSLVE